jgi:hypothetical protein
MEAEGGEVMSTVFVAQKPIKEPYWNARAAGLNTLFFAGVDFVHFTCSYRNLEGIAMFPHLYEVDVKRAKTCYKTHRVILKDRFGKTSQGPLLFLCPFEDLKIIKKGVTPNGTAKSSKRVKPTRNRAGASKPAKKIVEAELFDRESSRGISHI